VFFKNSKRRKHVSPPVYAAGPAGPADTIVVNAELVDSWLHVADGRDREPWPEVYTLLDQLQHEHPLRARKARLYINWLRLMALDYDLSWGRDMNDANKDRDHL
jgi:hypothetical protein